MFVPSLAPFRRWCCRLTHSFPHYWVWRIGSVPPWTIPDLPTRAHSVAPFWIDSPAQAQKQKNHFFAGPRPTSPPNFVQTPPVCFESSCWRTDGWTDGQELLEVSPSWWRWWGLLQMKSSAVFVISYFSSSALDSLDSFILLIQVHKMGNVSLTRFNCALNQQLW